MRILFIHQNFPAQFKHLAPALADLGHQVEALMIEPLPQDNHTNINITRYSLDSGNTPNIHPLAQDFESKVIRAIGCARAMETLRNKGFIPDIVIAHSGWGETLFLKEVFPETKFLSFIEFFYHTNGFDSNFDPEFIKLGLDDKVRVKIKNAANFINLDLMDWGLTPTKFQASSIPAQYRKHLSVIHDGIDTDIIKPNKHVTMNLQSGGSISSKDEIITFVNRNMEPYRGFHIFMRALPKIQKLRPKARVIFVGGDDISYGARPSDGRSHRQVMMDEVGDQLDMSRIHFVGSVNYQVFISLLQLTSLHIYLTYPFVLSWSLLEAMSVGAVVLGSNTAPVCEAIEDAKNGFLTDFFDHDALAERVDEILKMGKRVRPISRAARQTIIDRYDLKRVCLPKTIQLVEDVANGNMPKTQETP